MRVGLGIAGPEWTRELEKLRMPYNVNVLSATAADFLSELAGRLRKAYPAEDGVTLFPFPRLFFVATSGVR